MIDVQEDYTGALARPPFPYKKPEQLITAVNRLVGEAAAKDMVAVFLRQEFAGLFGTAFAKLFGRGTAIKGKPGTELDRRLAIGAARLFLQSRKGMLSPIRNSGSTWRKTG